MNIAIVVQMSVCIRLLYRLANEVILLTGEAEGQDSLCQGLSSHMEMALSMSWLGSYT